MIKINILNDFSSHPGGRFKKYSDDSGEDLFENILKPNVKLSIETGDTVEINLDGTEGFASSFLDQAFGSLAHEFGLSVVSEKITFISNEVPNYIREIKQSFKEWDEFGPIKRK